MSLLHSLKALLKKKEYNYFRSNCCNAPIYKEDTFTDYCVKCGKKNLSQHNIIKYKKR